MFYLNRLYKVHTILSILILQAVYNDLQRNIFKFIEYYNY